MKKVLFVTSHLGSGSTDLVEILNDNNRVQIYNQGAEYDHPTSLDWLFEAGHKNTTAAAIYGDHLLFNMNLTCKRLYDVCHFIYFVRPARATLNEIAKTCRYSEQGMFNYYVFRLRRIYEMAKRTPGAVLLTWENAKQGKGFDLIEDYLGLNTNLSPEHQHFVARFPDQVNYSVIGKAEEAYEKYLFHMKHLNLRQVR